MRAGARSHQAVCRSSFQASGGWGRVDSLRMAQCALGTCRALFYLCRRHDRGQRYCSRQCSAQARRQSQREAGRRYARSFAGRWAAARRQARRRERRGRKVTQQGSPPLGGAGTLAPPTPEVAMEATTFRVGLEPTDADRRDEKGSGRGPGAEAEEVQAGKGAVASERAPAGAASGARCAVCGCRADFVRPGPWVPRGGPRARRAPW